MNSSALPPGEGDLELQLAALADEDLRAVVQLSAALCAEPGVSVPPERTNHGALQRSVEIVRAFARDHGLHVIVREADADHPYPYVVVSFAEQVPGADAPSQVVALVGHLDVVGAQDASLWLPRLEGDELRARGAADMKTMVATYLVWMARWQKRPGPRPPVLLMLSCCEENGSAHPHHTRSTLQWLGEVQGITIRLAVVGERTGELEWMRPAPRVGPICKENRAWRWLRIRGADCRGIEVVLQLARAMAQLRRTVQSLNDDDIRANRRAQQPGLVSGLVNAFCLVEGDAEPAGVDEVLVEVRRPPGAALHSAAAVASGPVLIERFAALVLELRVLSPAVPPRLVAVQIGEDGNFNTIDGSGHMLLRLGDTTWRQVQAHIEGRVGEDLQLRVVDTVPRHSVEGLCLGLDVRELLDHRQAVDRALRDLQEALPEGAALESVLACPAWRCPPSHPDLQALERAYAQVIGETSPDLVKLHGNDGGQLAALQQQQDAVARRDGTGHAVVFGQVGRGPHGPDERHLVSSIRPYLDILDAWAEMLLAQGPGPGS
ncbi:MAG: M20/M25/M40 family metallo-hydrolase [Pseudomonadota bacterium]